MRDPIERQAAINETLSFLVEYCGAAFDEDMQNKLYQRLILLPSAEPERESIKWIPHKSIFGGLGERVYTCSKCGYNIGFHVENFCPNCGARTEGVSDERSD